MSALSIRRDRTPTVLRKLAKGERGALHGAFWRLRLTPGKAQGSRRGRSEVSEGVPRARRRSPSEGRNGAPSGPVSSEDRR
jgi:hypothetical protein